MSNSDFERFQKYWNRFVTQLKGKLMAQAKNETLTCSVMNLLLADSIEFWDSHHSEGGRWLEKLEKENPQKGSMVREILVNDMKFEDTSETISRNDLIKVVLPVGSTLAGYAISHFAGANRVIQAICTAAPAAIAYPVASGMHKSAREQKKKDIIRNYMDQLDKYRISVESILQDMGECEPG